MKAKVKVPFNGVPDGHAHPRRFEKDDVVEGALAKVAVVEKWATEIKAKTPTKPEEGSNE